MKPSLAAALAVFLPFAQPVAAEPIIFYDSGIKLDGSFNESGFNGAELFRETTGKGYAEQMLGAGQDRVELLRQAARKGNEPIVALGFTYASAVETVAKEFPETEFAIVDMVVPLPNVRSIVFREHEGSYLMGQLAAMRSKTGTIGFVGGMDIPVIRKFACGYVGGAKAFNPEIEIKVEMAGTTPKAFNDPARGAEITKSQIADGADVIFHASGGTGIGVLNAAADAGVLGIGVDMNQNGVAPGSVLTSMLKRVDYAVFFAFKDAEDGAFSTGVQSLGLEDLSVGYAVDEHNQSLLPGYLAAQVEEVSYEIISGTREVHDYMADNACPYGGV